MGQRGNTGGPCPEPTHWIGPTLQPNLAVWQRKLERGASCLRDLGHPNVQLPQLAQADELFQARIRNPVRFEVQLLQLREAPERTERSIGDAGPSQAEYPQPGKAFKVCCPGVGHIGVSQGEPSESH